MRKELVKRDFVTSLLAQIIRIPDFDMHFYLVNSRFCYLPMLPDVDEDGI